VSVNAPSLSAPAPSPTPAGRTVPNSRVSRTWAVLGFALLLGGAATTVGLVEVFVPLLFTVGALLAFRRSGFDEGRLLRLVLVLSAVVVILSLLSGISLTDEPFSTPGYARFFPDIYGQPYLQTYHVPLWPHALPIPLASYTFTTNSYDLYLPLLTFFQIPGVPYQVVSLLAWAGMVGLSYRSGRRFAALAMSTPFVGLCAAAGFNDFVGLFLLTAMVVADSSRKSVLADILAVGTKQFVPAISVVYHALQRQWLRMGVAIAATGLILLPFYLIDPGGVYCHAILISGSCGSPGNRVGDIVLGHVNYYLYPLWAFGLFHATFGRWARAAVRPLLGGRA
jgi:hypothetical protein